MAVSSTTSAGINVPEIVGGLMEVERQPVVKLESQIEQRRVVISALGNLKSKVSALESASKALQTPGTFSARSASSSDPNKVTATASSAATVGTYTVKVAQTAQSASLAVSGFTSANQVMDVTGFSLQAGSTTYRPNYAAVSSVSRQSETMTLSGSFVEGDEITLTVGGVALSPVTVSAGDIVVGDAAATRANIAVRLAAEHNLSPDGSHTPIVASASGSTLTFTAKSAGVGFASAAAAITPAVGSTGATAVSSINSIAATRQVTTVALSGAIQAGDKISLTVGGVNVPSVEKQTDAVTLSGTFLEGDEITLEVGGVALSSYVVVAGDIGIDDAETRANIAEQLAALHNASTDSAHTPILATTSSGVVTFTAKSAGVGFTSVSASLVSDDGETTLSSTGSDTYVVQSEDVVSGDAGRTLERVAAKLARIFSASPNAAHTPITATALGSELVLSAEGKGTTFAATASLVRGATPPVDAQVAVTNLRHRDATIFSQGDRIRFTLNGSDEQVFTVTTQTTASQVASAINTAAADAELLGIEASVDSNGSLILASSNPLQGIYQADLESPAFATYFGTSSFQALDQIRFTLSGGAEQSFALTGSTLTPSTIAAAINGAVAAKTLSGVRATVDSLGFLRLTALDPIKDLTSRRIRAATADVVAIGTAKTSAAIAATSSGQVDTISLSGKYVAGDKVSLTVNGVALADYVVVAGDIEATDAATRTNVAAKLVALYNASPDAKHTSIRASAVGETVSLVSVNAGVGFSSTVNVTKVGGGSTAVGAVSTTIAATAAGVPRNATVSDVERWLNRLPASVDAKLVQVGTDDYSLSVTSELTGSSNTLSLGGIKTVSGQVDTITLSGTYAAGNTVTLTVNGSPLAAYTVQAADVDGGGNTSAAYARIATALAASYNASLNPGHTSVTAHAVDGQVVLISDSPGVSFASAIAVANGSAGSAGGATLTNTVAATSTGAEFSAVTMQTARDAIFSVNGLGVVRSSNIINDVIAGLVFNLNNPVLPSSGTAISSISVGTFSDPNVYSTVINIARGSEDVSAAAVETFVTAYNDLMEFYRTESISARDPKERGVLNTDSTVRGFMDQMKSLYNNGIRLADGSAITFSSIGVQVQRDGSLFLNRGDLNSAVANGLQDKLAEGVLVGYSSGSLSLTSFLTRALRTTGLLSSHIDDEISQQNRLEQRVTDWEDKLSRLEQRYYRQYAALDALLFRLQTTSNALTSAIESLVNSQKNG